MIRTGQLELCAVPKPEPVRRVTLRTSVPRWLPPVVAAEVAAYAAAGGIVHFQFSRGERKIMRPRKPIPVSQWAEKYRRTLILDEQDKYKNPKNEATSEVLAEKRTTTWRGQRYIIKISTAPSFSALNDILWNSEYATPDGLKYKVRACMIDAMGGRTREVYSWAICHRGRVYP